MHGGERPGRKNVSRHDEQAGRTADREVTGGDASAASCAGTATLAYPDLHQGHGERARRNDEDEAERETEEQYTESHDRSVWGWMP